MNVDEFIARYNTLSKLSKEEKILKDLKTISEYVDVAKEAVNYDRMASFRGIEKPTYEELERRLNKAWGNLDMASLHLSNWVKQDVEKIKERFRVNNMLDLVNSEKYK